MRGRVTGHPTRSRTIYLTVDLMKHIIEYRADLPPLNEYPCRIVSPVQPSACCPTHMERIGHNAVDADWRFYYKRCTVCGYAVRCFYAPSILAAVEAGRELRVLFAEMNLQAGSKKRRTRSEIDAEIAAARQGPFRRKAS